MKTFHGRITRMAEEDKKIDLDSVLESIEDTWDDEKRSQHVREYNIKKKKQKKIDEQIAKDLNTESSFDLLDLDD